MRSRRRRGGDRLPVGHRPPVIAVLSNFESLHLPCSRSGLSYHSWDTSDQRFSEGRRHSPHHGDPAASPGEQRPGSHDLFRLYSVSEEGFCEAPGKFLCAVLYGRTPGLLRGKRTQAGPNRGCVEQPTGQEGIGRSLRENGLLDTAGGVQTCMERSAG